MTLSDHDALLAAVIADPDDDLARLAYADFLEENARTERVPCPECSPHAGDPCPECSGISAPTKGRCLVCGDTGTFPPGLRPERDPASGRHEGGWANCKTCHSRCTADPGFVLRSDGRAERAEFIRLDVERWRRWSDFASVCEYDRASAYPGSHADLRRIERRLRQLHVPRLSERWFGPVDGANWLPHVERGFAARVDCTWDAWQAHGREIAPAHPLEGGVEITDRAPFRLSAALGEPQWGWRADVDAAGGGASPLLPPEVWSLLAATPPAAALRWKFYDSEEAARADLSRVLILTARGRKE